MKKLLMAIVQLPMMVLAETWTDPETGIIWTYTIKDGETGVREASLQMHAIPKTTTGAITIPSTLGGCPVTSIGSGAFMDCANLTFVNLPEGLTSIEDCAFSGCSGLMNVTIPSSVTRIDFCAFEFCYRLKDLYFSGVNPPALSRESVFDGCHSDLVLHAPKGWKGRSRVFAGAYLVVEGESGTVQQVNVTVTNVIVNYIRSSVQSEFAIPVTVDTGFVNIITEVRGGAVVVPSSWAENYPIFTTKFGSDFPNALAKKTGKKDGAGNDMFVWQDYIAGTDPTDEKDVFTASITIVDGKVTISYSPELDADRKAMRKYTTWGKNSLMDATWTKVPEGREADYNFFKVSVEMR